MPGHSRYDALTCLIQRALTHLPLASLRAGDRQLAKFTRFALAVLEKENALTTYKRICEYVSLHRPGPFSAPLPGNRPFGSE